MRSAGGGQVGTFHRAVRAEGEERSWQIVPYDGHTAFKKVRIRDGGRIRDVVRHLQAQECVALIGAPYNEKSALVRDVAAALAPLVRYQPLYLDLWQASSQDEATFFTSLAGLIETAMTADAGQPHDTRPSRDEQPTIANARSFQNYLAATADAQRRHLVLLIDHLQALPHDLVHSLLQALRATYMERSVDAPRQVLALVTGGMNLVGLSSGTTSPFNIARPVLAAALSEQQSLALAEATLAAYDLAASTGALERIVEWVGGDRYGIPLLCSVCATLVQDHARRLIDRRCVDRAAQQLFGAEARQAPMREAIRMIEEDPDTILDVLHLLQHGMLVRSRARQMPTRTGADRLQLSGAVLLGDGIYTLKNEAYRGVLAQHFTAERVGHILRMAGRWQEAIAYLAPQLPAARGEPGLPAQAGDPAALAQLLEATVQSIYATDSLARAWELLVRGLQQGFGVGHVALYRALPAQARLERVYAQGEGETRPQSISLLDPEAVEARTYTYGSYALRGTPELSRLVIALPAGSRRLGIVIVERYIQGRDQHELPGQLPDLLHFLTHAGGAIENVMIRTAYREIGQAVLNARSLQPTLARVLGVVGEALGCEVASLYLIDGQALDMAAGIGAAANPEWAATARYARTGDHPAALCLREGRLVTVRGNDERLNQAPNARFGLGTYSWTYLPLQAAGAPLGTLELGFAEPARMAPGAESRATLAAFANQVAIAVHNAQLLRRTDEARARRAAELERLRSSSLAISASLDVPTALERVIADLLELFPGTEATIWGYDAGRVLPLYVLQSSVTDPAYLAARLDMHSPAGRAIQTGELQAVAGQARFAAGGQPGPMPPEQDSLVVVPLVSHDRSLGALGLYGLKPEPGMASPDPARLPVDSGTAELLAAFAAHAAVAIDNARLRQEELARQRLQQELAVGREVQRSLLPARCPEAPGWQFAAAYRPAHVVGGDFYDFPQPGRDPDRVGLVIADATDKGVPAAIFMALARTVLRTVALTGLGPAEVMKRANGLILNDSQTDLCLTAVYAVLYPGEGRLVYANGGHNRPLLYRAQDGSVSELAARGILLGAFENIELQERQVEIAPGDTLVLYTDGITDAANAAGDMFGEERLTSIIATHGNRSAAELLAALLTAVEEFVADADQADDITCVVVKRAAA